MIKNASIQFNSELQKEVTTDPLAFSEEPPLNVNQVNQEYYIATENITKELIHTDDKLFSCSYCEKKYSRKGSLKLHEMIHTGEKPFPCSYCDYRGTQLQSIKLHERIHHTGEKPYSCSYCEKTRALRYGFTTDSSFPLHSFLCTLECGRYSVGRLQSL